MDTNNIKLDLNTAKIIKLISGEEICCMLPKEQLNQKSTLLRLAEPMLIKYVPHITQHGVSDYIALVKWVGFTEDKIISIPKDKILTIANATIPFTERYKKLVQIDVKQQLPDYIERDLDGNDYDEFDKKISVKKEYKEKLNDSLQDIIDTLKMPSKRKHWGSYFSGKAPT